MTEHTPHSSLEQHALEFARHLLSDMRDLEEQYEDAQRKLSCGYDTGAGTNCGECLDCLKVNWHFAQEAVGNLKEQFEALRDALDLISRGCKLAREDLRPELARIEEVADAALARTSE